MTSASQYILNHNGTSQYSHGDDENNDDDNDDHDDHADDRHYRFDTYFE